MIVTVNGIAFTVAVHEQKGRHFAVWSCGACHLTGRSAAASVEIAINGAKASLLIHHTMEHGTTFTGYI